MRKLIKLIAILIGLAGVAIVLLVIYIDRVARIAVEEGSAYALGAPTTLQRADVKILAGEFDMDVLTIANPPATVTGGNAGAAAFQSDHFLKLGDGSVAVTLASLREPIVELPHLVLNNVDLNLERKDGRANYQIILDNLKRFETGQTPPPDDRGKRYIVRKLDIRNVVVHVDMLGAGGPGGFTTINVPIDEIIMTDVGSDGSGVRMGELASIIIKALFKAAIDKGGSLIPDDISGELVAGLGQLKDLSQFADIQKLGSDLESRLKNIAGSENSETVKQGMDKAKDALGNLLGGDEKKE